MRALLLVIATYFIATYSLHKIYLFPTSYLISDEKILADAAEEAETMYNCTNFPWYLFNTLNHTDLCT